MCSASREILARLPKHPPLRDRVAATRFLHTFTPPWWARPMENRKHSKFTQQNNEKIEEYIRVYVLSLYTVAFDGYPAHIDTASCPQARRPNALLQVSTVHHHPSINSMIMTRETISTIPHASPFATLSQSPSVLVFVVVPALESTFLLAVFLHLPKVFEAWKAEV